MANRLNDLKDREFGNITVLRLYPDGGTKIGKTKWLCRCSCKREYPILRQRLVTGRAIECRVCVRTKPGSCERCGTAFVGPPHKKYCSRNCRPSERIKNSGKGDRARHVEIVRLGHARVPFAEIARRLDVTRGYVSRIFHAIRRGERTLVTGDPIDYETITGCKPLPGPRRTVDDPRVPYVRKSRAGSAPHAPRIFTINRFR